MKASSYRDPSNSTIVHTVSVDDCDASMFGRVALERAVELVAQSIADRFLVEHGQEVLAKVSQEAVATLALTKAAVAIKHTIQDGSNRIAESVDRIAESVDRVDDSVRRKRGVFW